MSLATNSSDEKTVRSHRWELAGLGRAPFTYLGMYENRFDMGGGRSKPGGACNYCGQGILYCFKVQSSDGRRFVVGCDCIAHCHDPAERIVLQAKRALKDHKATKARERKAESRAAVRAQRQAQWDAEAARQKAAVQSDPLFVELAPYAEQDDFIASIRTQMERRPLSEAQEAAVKAAVARIKRKAEMAGKSRHLGDVGRRIALSGAVEFSRCIYAGTNRNYDPDRWMTKIRTDDLAIVVWFGAYGFETGRRVAGTATISKLDRYNDEDQTVVKNPRWKDA